MRLNGLLHLIGQATFKKIKQGGDIDMGTIAKLCALLDCQPGDIMEYVPDESRAAKGDEVNASM
jgi:DNA-binding Xre family transcriptional regulator